MSTPSTQDQVNRDHFRVPEWVRSREAAASRPTNARVRTYTLLFGVVSGLTFSLSSWIYEAVIYSQAHVAYAWIPLVVGTAVCVLLTTLAAGLTYLANKALLGIIFWLMAAGLVTELIIALPLRIEPRLMLLFEPGLRAWLPAHPYNDTIKTWILIGFFSLGFFFAFSGLLQLVLVEQGAHAATPASRLAPYLFCITVMLLASVLAGNLVNNQLRTPFVATNNLIQFAQDSQGRNVDPTVARNMHLSSVNTISSLLNRPRRLFLGRFNAVYGQVEVLIDFAGTWASCTTIYGEPVFCQPISSP
ncbi:MAG TPA: hypothetical protein VII97_14570 [Anaerolineales bacterium]